MRVKASQVVAQMRGRIVQGQWPPGSHIPIKPELRRLFNASDGTIQKALDTLSNEGFLWSRGRLGTFVCEQTPDRCRVALALGEMPKVSAWLDSAAKAAASLSAKGHAWIDSYYNCSRASLQSRTPGEGLIRLREDIAVGRLSGVVFYGLPPELPWEPGLSVAGLAHVRAPAARGAPGLPGVVRRGLVDWTMRFLAARRRRRLAILTTFGCYGDSLAPVLRGAQEAGLETRRCAWTQVVSPSTNVTARAVVELMMTLPKAQRPDALLVMDDHLITHAAQGVADSGVSAPREIDLVSVANFPDTMPVAVPVTFVGHDLVAELSLALALIDEQRAGSHSPPDRLLETTALLAQGIDPCSPAMQGLEGLQQ